MFTQDEMFDKNKVLAKLSKRGKYAWYQVYSSQFVNHQLVSVEVLDTWYEVVLIPASWVKEVK